MIDMITRKAIYIYECNPDIKRKAIKYKETVPIGTVFNRKAIYIYECNPDIKRKAIYYKNNIGIKRTPIYYKWNPNVERKHIAFYKKTLKYWENYYATHGKIPIFFIKEVLSYYELRVRQALNLSGYRYMKQDLFKSQKGKKWGQLYKFCSFIKEKAVDFRIYIDSQFERLINWNHKQKYPYFEQMYSESAWKAYEAYIKHYKASRSLTEDVKVKPVADIGQTERKEIIKAVIKDCELMLDDVENRWKQKRLAHLTPQQRELQFLVYHSILISKYFWATINWATKWLGTFTNKSLMELCEQVRELQASPSRMELISKLVISIKRRMGIPLLDEDFM